MRFQFKSVGPLLLVCLGTAGATAQQQQQQYFERETNQHLGSTTSSWFSILQVVKNGENHHDTSNLYTYRDSTFLVRRPLDGRGLLEKTLIRAEERKLFFDRNGEPRFDVSEKYSIEKKAEDLLPEDFNYDKLDNPVWPCSFAYRPEGIFLVHEDQERLIKPLAEFQHLFREYIIFASREDSTLETVEGFSGTEGWYYVNFAPQCMADPVGICRQVVVPIPLKLMLETRAELLGTVEIKKKKE